MSPELKKNLRTCALAVCLVHLSGCGQTGPLYLPKDPPGAQLDSCPMNRDGLPGDKELLA
jgi:predicted small lipoprotein YifL